MRKIYQACLRLYPAEMREAMGAEMLGVQDQLWAECAEGGRISLLRFHQRELTGLLGGALREQARRIWPSFGNFVPLRGLVMRTGMRFPVAAVVFMLLSFLGVLYAIFKAQSVSIALTEGGPMPVYLPGGIVVLMVIAYVAGLAGWAVLYALKRSGAERLSRTETWSAAK